jgi:hypothetical protein
MGRIAGIGQVGNTQRFVYGFVAEVVLGDGHSGIPCSEANACTLGRVLQDNNQKSLKAAIFGKARQTLPIT